MVYQLNAKNIFLTYPQIPSVWTHQKIIQSIPAGFTIYTVGREIHTDGGFHFHGLFHYPEGFRTKDPRAFDIDGFHPNVQGSRKPAECARYCEKDGDFEKEGTFEGSIKRGWGELCDEADGINSFLELVKTHHPRDYVLNLEKLQYFAKFKYRTIITPYIPNPLNVFIIPNNLSDWDNQRRDGDRPKSLWLCGNSRLGKTQWARTLGTHIYWNNQYNLDDWNTDAEYLVIDDISWKFVPAKKALLGAQLTFTLTDKYRKKVTLDWGKPVIYLCNKDMDVYHTCDESDWLRDNCTYIYIDKKLF